MNCCIVTGGNIVEAFALPYLEEHSFDLLIGVDGGLDFFILSIVDRTGS